MKLSVFTVATPDFTPERLAAEAAKAGIDGIEWRFKDVPADAAHESPSFWRNNLCSIPEQADAKQLQRFSDAARRHKLEIVSVTPYLLPDQIEETERVLQAAKQLGARYIRVGVAKYDKTIPVKALFEQQYRYLDAIVPLCKSYGVKGLIETHHKTITPSAGLALRVAERYDSEHLGVLYDPGNMIHEGYENFRLGLELLGPYLAHVHVKNAGWALNGTREDGTADWQAQWKSLRDGIIDWREVIDDLKSVEYDGYLGIEDFSGTFESEELLQQFAQWANRLLA